MFSLSLDTNKKIITISSSFFVGVFLCLIFVLPVKATTTIFSAYDIVATPSDGVIQNVGYPFQEFTTSVTGTFKFLQVDVGGVAYGQTCSSWQPVLYDRTSASYISIECFNTTTVFSSGYHLPVFIPVVTTTNLYPSHQYDLFFDNYNFGRLSPSTTYTNTSGYDGAGWRASSSPVSAKTYASAGGGYDIYFRVGLENVEESDSYINFDPPFYGQQCNFRSFHGGFYLNRTSLQEWYSANENFNFSAVVHYGFSEDYLPFEEFQPQNSLWSDWFFSDNSVGGYLSTWNITNFNTYPVGNTYYIQTCLCSANTVDDCEVGDTDNLFLCSDVTSFTMSQCSGALPLWQGTTTTTIQSVVDSDIFDVGQCEEKENLITEGFCKLFVWLFVPDPVVFRKFDELKEQVKYKPPFGYFTVYQDALQSLEVSTSTTSTISNLSSTSTIDFASITELSIYQTLYTIFGYFIYLMFGFYIYYRFKHFAL